MKAKDAFDGLRESDPEFRRAEMDLTLEDKGAKAERDAIIAEVERARGHNVEGDDWISRPNLLAFLRSRDE